MIGGECPLLAQSGHTELHCTCPLLGVKQTSPSALHISAFDPKRTWGMRTGAPHLRGSRLGRLRWPNLTFACEANLSSPIR